MNKYTMSHLQLTKWIAPSTPFDTQWGIITGSCWLELKSERLKKRGINVEIVKKISNEGRELFALVRT